MARTLQRVVVVARHSARACLWNIAFERPGLTPRLPLPTPPPPQLAAIDALPPGPKMLYTMVTNSVALILCTVIGGLVFSGLEKSNVRTCNSPPPWPRAWLHRLRAHHRSCLRSCIKRQRCFYIQRETLPGVVSGLRSQVVAAAAAHRTHALSPPMPRPTPQLPLPAASRRPDRVRHLHADPPDAAVDGAQRQRHLRHPHCKLHGRPNADGGLLGPHHAHAVPVRLHDRHHHRLRVVRAQDLRRTDLLHHLHPGAIHSCTFQQNGTERKYSVAASEPAGTAPGMPPRRPFIAADSISRVPLSPSSAAARLLCRSAPCAWAKSRGPSWS